VTVIETRPSGSSVASPTNVGSATGGAASRHAALADDDDLTYVSITRANKDGADERKKNLLTLTFGAPSPASGAKLKDIHVKVKVAYVGGGTAKAPKVQVFRESYERVKKKLQQIQGVKEVPKTTPTTLELARRTAAAIPSTPTLQIVGAPRTADLDFNLYEVFYNYTYVEKPVASVSGPSGSITSNLPTVTWGRNLDEDGGTQTHYQVKIFSSAQYGAGGFLPESSGATKTSGAVQSGTNAYQTVGAQLADGTYRAYVKVGQTVNGTVFYGDWSYSEFTVASTRPGVPTSLTVTPDDANGRIQVSATRVAASAGPPAVAASDFIEFQRSTDAGTTWEDVRTSEGDGRVAPDSGTGVASVYDHEVGNGVSVQYRARGVKDFGTLVDDATSDYTTASTADTWDGTDWWLKNPLLPSQNIKVYLDSLSEETQAVRQGVFQAIGATNTVVVADTRAAKSGTVTFRVDTDEEKADLDTLIQASTPLLLQGVPGHHWDDRYVMFGDYQRVRAPDKAFVEATLDTTSWIEVEAPSANIGE
jgi:hypothetical protein